MIIRRSWSAALALGILVASLHGRVMAFPVDGDQTTLPPKTELNEDALAWISTARDEANVFGLWALLDEAERAAVPPGDGDGFVDKAGGENDREVGAAVEADADLALGDSDVGGHVDEVAENLARLSVIVAAHAVGHQAIEA